MNLLDMSILLLMLAAALILLSVPFIINRNFKRFIFMSLIVIPFSLIMYQLSGDKKALKDWLTKGKQHYALLKTFDELGGVEGAIIRIQQKLTENPNDARGWFILGKLYLSKDDKEHALDAFRKARDLQPNDPAAAGIR